MVENKKTMSSHYKLNNLLKLGIFGGIVGGLIALIGFWILSPTTDSLTLFIILRVIVGSIVAMAIGPLIINYFYE